MSENTNLTLTSDNETMLLVGGTSKSTFCSLVPKTEEEKIDFYNAISAPDKKVGEMINMEINLSHVYAEECVYRSKETGELQDGVRIVLIDNAGVSYNTSSIGVFHSLTRIFQIFGAPQTWKKPKKVRVKQITPSDDKRVLTLELVR